MPSLILQYGDDILKEYDLGQSLTIGRLPDNTVIIDNPAVSGHHARVFCDGNSFVVEDLNSTNGTFVNDIRIVRHHLRDGDAVLVGKHKLVFDESAEVEPTLQPAAARPVPGLHDTVYLDTKKQKELLSKGPVQWPHKKSEPATPPARVAVGILRVLSGRADQAEYRLERHTSVVGKSDRAVVRLQGWWKPNVALVITRSEDSYIVTPLGGRARINNRALKGRQTLKDGDVLSVSGLVLEFSSRPVGQEQSGSTHAADGRRIAESA